MNDERIVILQQQFNPFFLYHLIILARGYRGGIEGVSRGFGGVNLTEPPRNPL